MTARTDVDTGPGGRRSTAGGREHAVRLRLAELFGPAEEWSPRLVEALIASFLVRALDYLEVLAEAIAAGDPDAVTSHSHGLKGMAGNLGATELAALSESLESRARGGQLAAAPRLLAQLRAELEAVRPAMMRVLSCPSSAVG